MGLVSEHKRDRVRTPHGQVFPDDDHGHTGRAKVFLGTGIDKTETPHI